MDAIFADHRDPQFTERMEQRTRHNSWRNRLQGESLFPPYDMTAAYCVVAGNALSTHSKLFLVGAALSTCAMAYYPFKRHALNNQDRSDVRIEMAEAYGRSPQRIADVLAMSRTALGR